MVASSAFDPCNECQHECDKLEDFIKFYFDMYETIILGQQPSMAKYFSMNMPSHKPQTEDVSSVGNLID